MKTLLLLTLIIMLTLSNSIAFTAFSSLRQAQGKPLIPQPSFLNIPIVFVSRNRMDTVDGLHVGPPVNVRGREATPGGRLRVLHLDGTVVDLTDGRDLYDVADPDVSYDAKHVVFAGVASPGWPPSATRLPGWNCAGRPR